jgi:lipopolysaccharide transport system ATP-binding protein
MSSPIIRVENLSKKYIVSHQQEGYATFRDAMTNGVRSLTRSLFNRQERKSSNEEFWALKDVNFEIRSGDRVGIIGRNGAGKSTLLKVLSRITEPTSGRIQIKGRVASLLEVGTGFHPELTGRENVFLNGAILGMEKSEIKRKFDAIVAFAEIERFLDTPVKRYSSGMYVRLAFAVAAHLEPEILIVDEVLAVGDVQFQKKCMSKMREVGSEGRTVLFVSHNMQAVQDLCNSGILLNSGSVEKMGTPHEIIHQYLSLQKNNQPAVSTSRLTKNFCIQRAVCFGDRPHQPILPLGKLTMEFDVHPRTATRDLSLHILIRGEADGRCYLGFDSYDFKAILDGVTKDVGAKFTLQIPQCPLPPGTYYVDVYAKSYSNQTFEEIEQIVQFSVAEQAVYGSRLYDEKWHGLCLSPASIQVEALQPSLEAVYD